MLASAGANAQTIAAAQTSVELIALLKPSTAAVPTWATSAMASASMRARLGQPLELQTLFPAPSVVSSMRNLDPNLPMNRLNRYVKLRFPSLTSALAMRRILLGNGFFEHVEVANILKFDYTAINVTEPYYQNIQSGTKNYSYSGTPMLNNPYGANAPYFPPDRSSWPQEQSQWYLQAMNFPQAWELIGDDAFDSNPTAGFYGSANVAVLDSGIDPECDPNFMPAGSLASNGALSSQFWSERTGIAGARCGPSATSECGSNYNTSSNKKMLYAPAAHILSTLFGTWAGGAHQIIEAPGRILGLAGCTHELFPADSQNYTFASTHPSFNSHYGMCTGTSMSAPILSGLAGLVRSVNPLLSIDDTYTAMQNQALALTGVIPVGALNTQQPLADKTLEKTLGQFGGTIAQNRLIPMFAARSSVRDDGTPHIDWLYSTKPQMLNAAILGDLYFNHALATEAGTRRRVTYDASTSLPPVAGYSYGNVLKSSANTPHASFYLFATQRRPTNTAGPSPLVPLYRMVTDSPIANLNSSANPIRLTGACDARKHTYATAGSVINGQPTKSYFSAATRLQCILTRNTITAVSTAVPPAAEQARYSVVTIEGFIYSPLLTQPRGTTALYLRYSPNADSYALVTANDVNRVDYVGYRAAAGVGSPETLLGYVYENDAVEANGSIQTTDGDDWPANWELAVGLNADRADSDCDGVNDSVEYPLASLPLSDPKQNTCFGNGVDRYAVANIPQAIGKVSYRLRNYTAANSSINFNVYDGNGGAHNVALNPGNAACVPNKEGTLPHNMTIWTCTLNLAPGAAGNEAISLDYGTCQIGNPLVSRIEILSPDGYTVNNQVTVNVCP